MKERPSKQNRTIMIPVVVVVWAMTAGWMNCIADAASAGEQPNIVFIEVDDLTYSYLGCMGNRRARTPSIDSLAKRGVLFKNAVCQGMMCGPSRNGLMTGLYPHNLGFYRNGQMKQLPQDVWTLPKALQRSGYHTAWIGKSHIRPFEAKSNPKARVPARSHFQILSEPLPALRLSF